MTCHQYRISTLVPEASFYRDISGGVVKKMRLFFQAKKRKGKKGPKRGPARGGSHVACMNFKMSRVVVYKCLSLIVGFAVTVAMWPREVVSCRDFIVLTVVTFWAMSLVGIYPGRAS